MTGIVQNDVTPFCRSCSSESRLSLVGFESGFGVAGYDGASAMEVLKQAGERHRSTILRR